jgi:glycoprotein endo-alpha-1,2-mannosidase
MRRVLALTAFAAAAFASASASSSARAAPEPLAPLVHAFFYLWYGTPSIDGRWSHWNHSILPHWAPATRALWPGPEVA